ncbi:MAG: cupredoxin domain-containing protein [Actinomycetota bacterium]|nr:cupredoxin domain-containing protein [Actinomycetota bacterium]
MSAPETKEKIPLHVDPTEKAWIRTAIVVLGVFIVAVTVAGFMLGIQVPTNEQRVNPQTIQDAPPWSEPGVREIVAGEKYDVYIVAKRFFYEPSTVEVPVGAEVTFYVTSTDVQHGFKIEHTNINFMAIPGEVSKLTATFTEAGTYDYICTEYCGLGHAVMFGSVTATP